MEYKKKGGDFLKAYRTLEDFEENCWLFSTKLFNFVESISGENRWFFDVCYHNVYERPNTYQVLFSSYETPEYAKFVLSIYVTHTPNGFEFKITKQVTDLS